MFDRLVESTAAGAVKDRKNFFITSALVVSVLSLTAIVVGIFADDYSIGSGGVELAELIAPVEMAAAPKQDQPKLMPRTQAKTSTVPVRTDNIRNIDEAPDKVPQVATTPSGVVARPLDGRFDIGKFNTDADVSGGTGIDTGAGRNGGGPDSPGIAVQPAKTVIEEEAPPRSEKVELPKAPKSGGVLNGKALNLPIPTYSAAARAVNAQGQVTVQVTLDENGHVIAVNAVNGNPLLRTAAVDAAKRARFSPTLLSGVPVKVTGVIVYNFNRG